jgi:hypothetical protein
MHGAEGESKFSTPLQMINSPDEHRHHLLSQLQTKDDQIETLNHQVERLTQLLFERTKGMRETDTVAVSAGETKVIPIDSRRKGK